MFGAPSVPKRPGNRYTWHDNFRLISLADDATEQYSLSMTRRNAIPFEMLTKAEKKARVIAAEIEAKTHEHEHSYYVHPTLPTHMGCVCGWICRTANVPADLIFQGPVNCRHKSFPQITLSFPYTLPYSTNMRNNERNKQTHKTRRASDRDYVEALDYLAELSADDQQYQDGDRDFVKKHFSFVTVK